MGARRNFVGGGGGGGRQAQKRPPILIQTKSGACPGAPPPLEIEKPKKKGHQSKF